MESWYLIHAKPRREALAKENLERQGYRVYLPLVQIQGRGEAAAITAAQPMFPRYLFIYLCDERDDWRPIRSTIGVASLVKFGQQPARVPDSLITALQKGEDGRGIHIIQQKDYAKGQKVTVAAGPFAGYEGIFQVPSGRDRVVILMKVLESYVKVELDRKHLEEIT